MTDPGRGAPGPADIVGIFRDRLQIAVPSEDTDLVAQGMLDSLGFVDLIVALEEEYDVEVHMDRIEFDDFRTARTIALWVQRERTGG